ncbi:MULTISPECIES: hypothetical protein, partial [unclassified Streptomyces]
EPYWVELDPERTAALRNALAGPESTAQPAPVDRAAVLREAADEIAGIDFHPNARARSLDIATGLAHRLRRLAGEAAAGAHQPATTADRAEPDPSPTVLAELVGTIRDLQALQQPLVDALRHIRDDMHRAWRGGDEWAMEWMSDVWAELPLPVRAAGGDEDAVHELAAAGAHHPTEARTRIADALAAADGWEWAPSFDKTRSPSYQEFLRQADVALAALATPAVPAAPEETR